MWRPGVKAGWWEWNLSQSFEKGPRMEENIFSCTVYGAANQLTALGGLMMGFNGDSIELETEEIHSVGTIINKIGQELKTWNSQTNPQPSKGKEWAREPLIKQFDSYRQFKEAASNAVLLFQSDGHCSAFFDDAYLLVKLFDMPLTLSSGIPECQINPTRQRTLAGDLNAWRFDVAVCEGESISKVFEVGKEDR